MLFRFLTSGESHGKCLNVIIEGVPSGVGIDEKYINSELERRQTGYGRGERMQIEKDTAIILSGVRFGLSTGSPVCLEISNRDWQNWQIPMSIAPVEKTDENIKLIDSKKIINVRPGHADLAGALKYNHTDIRNILERSSARETAARVAAGAIAKSILKEFDIQGLSCVTQIGNVKTEIVQDIFKFKDKIENSELRTFDEAIGIEMKKVIDKAKSEGDSIGGKFSVVFKNVPAGLGSHVHWDRRIDGLIAQAVMSIPAVKSVEIGIGCKAAQLSGANTHDEIFIENNMYVRKTNNAGGIEGGITNGEDIVISAVMKAIPTMKKPLNSIAIDKKAEVRSHFERSDTCAVPSCAVAAEAMCAIVLVDAMFEKFSHDSIDEMKTNYLNYSARMKDR